MKAVIPPRFIVFYFLALKNVEQKFRRFYDKLRTSRKWIKPKILGKGAHNKPLWGPCEDDHFL